MKLAPLVLRVVLALVGRSGRVHRPAAHPCRLCGCAEGHWSGCLLSRRGLSIDARDLLRQLGIEG